MPCSVNSRWTTGFAGITTGGFTPLLDPGTNGIDEAIFDGGGGSFEIFWGKRSGIYKISEVQLQYANLSKASVPRSDLWQRKGVIV